MAQQGYEKKSTSGSAGRVKILKRKTSCLQMEREENKLCVWRSEVKLACKSGSCLQVISQHTVLHCPHDAGQLCPGARGHEPRPAERSRGEFGCSLVSEPSSKRSLTCSRPGSCPPPSAVSDFISNFPFSPAWFFNPWLLSLPRLWPGG